MVFFRLLGGVWGWLGFLGVLSYLVFSDCLGFFGAVLSFRNSLGPFCKFEVGGF